ncbi:MAG: molybdopterin converting factor subunit 1 [Planctomycetaceae bacterium]|nr:molybdopterin converting factor subunit 1 [Planctomycetaceae bacterium]
MNLTVKLFARARDLAGTSHADVTLSNQQTVEEMLSQLVIHYPQLASIRESLLVAVNNEYVPSETVIPANAEVACFPPVSGG